MIKYLFIGSKRFRNNSFLGSNEENQEDSLRFPPFHIRLRNIYVHVVPSGAILLRYARVLPHLYI